MFLSARPCGRDRASQPSTVAAVCFYPRARADATTIKTMMRIQCMFLSARPCGRDQRVTHNALPHGCFYPRARADATQPGMKSSSSPVEFLSARPCGRDPVLHDEAGVLHVSIRAPVRTRPGAVCPSTRSRSCFYPRARADATFCEGETLAVGKVSIRAPVRTRPSSTHSVGALRAFLSARPCGRDPVSTPALSPPMVSIRAPVRTRPPVSLLAGSA